MGPLMFRLITLIGLALAILSCTVPTLMIPFVNVLPYLQTTTLLQRTSLVVLTYVFVGVMVRMAMSTNQWKGAREIVFRDRAQLVGFLAGIAFMAYLAAALSANTFGLMVRVFPSRPFAQELVITQSEAVGSKYRSLELVLRSEQRPEPFELKLSHKVFGELPKLKVGDTLRVEGEENIFGSYVQSFSVVKSPLP
jgi:hypothetical protein